MGFIMLHLYQFFFWYKPLRLNVARVNWRGFGRTASSGSLGLTGYYQVDMLGVRYKSVSFGGGGGAWSHQIGETKYRGASRIRNSPLP